MHNRCIMYNCTIGIEYQFYLNKRAAAASSTLQCGVYILELKGNLLIIQKILFTSIHNYYIWIIQTVQTLNSRLVQNSIQNF